MNIPIPFEQEFPDIGELLVKIVKFNAHKYSHPLPSRQFIRKLPIDIGLLPVTVGRNEKCPCGSGKKVKNCCQQ